MKGDLQSEFDKVIEDVPRQFLERTIESKLQDAGIEPTPKRVERIADAIMAGEEHFEIEEDTLHPGVTLAFSDEEIAELTGLIQEFYETQLPEVISKTAAESADKIFKTLKRDWPAQKAWQDGQFAQFKINLELRWGNAFDLYRMILTSAREAGEEYSNRLHRSRAKRNRNKRVALSRLHARACRVAEEILVLMKEGFADGAMARWRTLHEITTVSILIADFDDEMAERYLLHEIVEAMRALEIYEETYSDLGFGPPSKRDAQRTRREFDAVRQRFGKEYCTPYGWAAKHLAIDGKRFSDLEKAARRSHMRSHYKMASQNVHAGTKGITDQLGLIDGSQVLLAGPSNAGLEEPAQNTVISLVQVTVLLYGQNWKIDDILLANVFFKLRDKAIDAFILAGRKLKRDEDALRK